MKHGWQRQRKTTRHKNSRDLNLLTHLSYSQTFRLFSRETCERSNFQTFQFRSLRALKLLEFPVAKLASAQIFRLFRLRSFRSLKLSDFAAPKLPSSQTFRFSSCETSERSKFQIFQFRSFRPLKLSDFPGSEASDRSNFQTLLLRGFRTLKLSDFSCSEASERSNFRTFPAPQLPNAQTFRLSSSKASERSNFQIFTFLSSKFEFSNSGIFKLSYCQALPDSVAISRQKYINPTILWFFLIYHTMDTF